MLVDETIQTGDLADLSASTAKIANNAITTNKIGLLQVDTTGHGSRNVRGVMAL